MANGFLDAFEKGQQIANNQFAAMQAGQAAKEDREFKLDMATLAIDDPELAKQPENLYMKAGQNALKRGNINKYTQILGVINELSEPLKKEARLKAEKAARESGGLILAYKDLLGERDEKGNQVYTDKDAFNTALLNTIKNADKDSIFYQKNSDAITKAKVFELSMQSDLVLKALTTREEHEAARLSKESIEAAKLESKENLAGPTWKEWRDAPENAGKSLAWKQDNFWKNKAKITKPSSAQPKESKLSEAQIVERIAAYKDRESAKDKDSYDIVFKKEAKLAKEAEESPQVMERINEDRKKKGTSAPAKKLAGIPSF